MYWHFFQIHDIVGSMGFIVNLQSGFTNFFSYQQCTRIFPHPPQYLVLSKFIIFVNLRVEIVSNFNIIFLIPNDNSDFSTLSFQFLFSFCFFFSYWFLGVIYIFWILKHCLANIFSQYLTCLLFLFLHFPSFN